MNNRFGAGWIYFLIGFVIVSYVTLTKVLFIMEVIRQVSPILWCIGWAAMGAGAGLINTRNHGEKENAKNNSSVGQQLFHLVFYWGFVVVVGAIAAFVAASLHSELNVLSIDISITRFYSLSALVGLIIGFMGDKLYDILREKGKNS